MQFRNICKANAQKLLLYQNLCCSEQSNGLLDTVSKNSFEYWGFHFCCVSIIFNYIVLNNNCKLLKKIDVNELRKVVNKSIIERIKVGANMRLSTLEKICKYLKCQPEDILSFK